MKMVKGLLAAALLLVLPAAEAVNGGAWNSAPAKRMDAGSVNNWFSYRFPVTDSPAAGARITRIYYQYALGQGDIRQGRLVVNLCSEASTRCIDISAAQSGETTAFQGEDARTPFTLRYMVVNHSSIGLATGTGTTQITVNWALTP